MSWNIPSLQANSLNFSPVLKSVEAADRLEVMVNGDLVKTVNIIHKENQLILKQASTFSQMNHSLNFIDVDMSRWMRWIPPSHSLDISPHLFESELKHLKRILQCSLHCICNWDNSQPCWVNCKLPAWQCQLCMGTLLRMNWSWSICESVVCSAFKCNKRLWCSYWKMALMRAVFTL